MKKIFIVLLLVLFNFQASATLIPKSKSMGRLAKYDKVETAKGFNTKITFVANADCMVKGKLIYKEIETSESNPNENEQDYPLVRVVNLYVKSNQDCNPDAKMVKTKQTYTIKSDPDRLTKIFLTYEDTIKVEKIDSEKK